MNRYCCFLLLLLGFLLGQASIFYRLQFHLGWDCTLWFTSSSSSSSSIVVEDTASFVWLPSTVSKVRITRPTTNVIHAAANDNTTITIDTPNMDNYHPSTNNNSKKSTTTLSSSSALLLFSSSVFTRMPTTWRSPAAATTIPSYSPPKGGPIIQPYTQQHIIRLARDTEMNLHVFIYLPHIQTFHLYSLTRYGRVERLGFRRKQVFELIVDGFFVSQNSNHNHHNHNISSSSIAASNNNNNNNNRIMTEPYNPNKKQQQPIQIVLDVINDDASYPCMDDPNHQACNQKKYPPLIDIGSVPIHHPNHGTHFLHSFPFLYYINCMYLYRLQTLFPHQQQQQRKKKQIAKRQAIECPLRPELTQFASSTNSNVVWESLIPQIIWRGSCLRFVKRRLATRHLQECYFALQSSNLSHNTTTTVQQVADYLLQQSHNLIPRCIAVAMTLQAEIDWSNQHHPNSNSTSNTFIQHYQFSLDNHSVTNYNNKLLPWINAKFTRNAYHERRYKDLGSTVFLGDYMSPSVMAQYKYQIDLGGNGGTTWLGTITKLAMPGLLFHHVTPTKDFFYDDMQPWVHYVPIHTNLSNLYELFVWAETHPIQAQQIARQGQELARYLMSDQAYATIFEQLFVDRVQQIAAAYRPSSPDETIESILHKYRRKKFQIQLLGTCNEKVMWCDLSPIKNITGAFQ